jgi:hypothetical protein
MILDTTFLIDLIKRSFSLKISNISPAYGL